MEAKKSKTVFIEYSSSEKGQHFMTVVQNVDHQRIIIGRVYREPDPQNKRYNYYATDFAGNQVFADYKDLHAIKQQFIVHGNNLALLVPNPKAIAQQKVPFVISKNPERNNVIKNIRDKKTDKAKTQEVSKPKPSPKTTENQKEKIEESKNQVEYKDVEKGKDEINSKENTPTDVKSDSEEPVQTEQDIATERMAELSEVREDGTDKEQDLEIEM